jgi:hypothetical protein
MDGARGLTDPRHLAYGHLAHKDGSHQLASVFFYCPNKKPPELTGGFLVKPN